jgi:AcrR family transcriptional regulator
MAAVAQQAGVATGTAYVHYASKDELVLATYREVKADLTAAALAGLDARDPAETSFEKLWANIYTHLAGDPDRARFLLQVEVSPYARTAHTQVADEMEDELLANPTVAALAGALVDLPLEVIYLLGLGPAVRMAAESAAGPLSREEVSLLAASCWRAISKP